MRKLRKYIALTTLLSSLLFTSFTASAATDNLSIQQSQTASIAGILSSLQAKLSALLKSSLGMSASSQGQFAQVSPPSQVATLAISPSSQSVNVGDTFTVAIILNTNGSNTDGVDINSLNYNPSILQLQDADTSVAGIQIEPGSLYPIVQTNTTDASIGKINFSQVTQGGTNFNGQGTLATLTFKAVSAGTSQITFDFTLNLTTDTNVASQGADILSSVTGGTVVSSVIVDNPATISTPSVSVSFDQATIAFTTNESTDSFIEYGPTTSYGNQTTTSNNSTNFSFNILTLSPDTTYNYRITALDSGGNISQSINRTFKTSGLPDTTDPSEITTLSIVNPTQTSLTLGWTAVGDDGNVGQAMSYEIKYSTNPPSSTASLWWNSAIAISGAPFPKVSGGVESYTVASLSPGATYYFAIKATDDVGNTSALNLSSIKQGTTSSVLDTTPPTISNINVSGITTTGATITWDTGEPANSQVAYGQTISYGGETALKTPLVSSHSHTLSSLSPNTLYHYAVKSIDSSGNLSISSDNTFTTLIIPDTTAPSAVTNLTFSDITANSAKLSWTAVGDDGNSGTATSYDIRHSTSPITLANWASATQIVGEPTPKLSGTSESMTIGSLVEDTTYYFALRTTDDSSNTSGLSNVVTFTTLSKPVVADTIAPVISGLASSGVTTTGATIGWTTDEDADSLVIYGTSESALTSSVISADLSDTHSLGITDLSPNTQYFYKSVSKDSVGNQATSTTQSFTTATPPQATPASSSGGGGGGGGGGGSVSGGGGGGSLVDITPPAAPLNFIARSADSQISLSWNNPKDSDFIRVTILRSDNVISSNILYSSINQTADLIYDGLLEEYTDVGLQNGKTYHYAIYSYDKKPNYSTPVIVSSTPLEGVEVITIAKAPVNTSVSTIPSTIATNTTTTVSALRVDGPFSVGMTSDQVTILQRMLSQDRSIYPEGIMSGYYGDLTRKAVETFQCRYMSICQGAPSTNGYGLAGPSTRAKINELLGGTVTTTVPTAPVVSSDQEREALIQSIKDQIVQLQLLLKSLLEQLVESLKAEVSGGI